MGEKVVKLIIFGKKYEFLEILDTRSSNTAQRSANFSVASVYAA